MQKGWLGFSEISLIDKCVKSQSYDMLDADLEVAQEKDNAHDVCSTAFSSS